MAKGDNGEKLADILYGNHNQSRREKTSQTYQMDELDEPKHVITNPELFAKSREVLGNLISKRMKTSGGTDIDWLIEHNGGFMIFELKIFHDDRIAISKAQMIAYEKLYEKLPRCHILFIGHDDIDFKDLNQPVWLFHMEDWKSGKIPRIEWSITEPKHNENATSGYRIERDFMEKIDVKILRDRIDNIWERLET